MNGRLSDLRPGLAEQMTEIHDPIRLTFIFACSKEKFHKVIKELEWAHPLINNRWFYVYTMDDSGLHPINEWPLEPADWLHSEVGHYAHSLDFIKGLKFINATLAVKKI